MSLYLKDHFCLLIIHQERFYLGVEQQITVFLRVSPAGFLALYTRWAALVRLACGTLPKHFNLNLMMPPKLDWGKGGWLSGSGILPA